MLLLFTATPEAYIVQLLTADHLKIITQFIRSLPGLPKKRKKKKRKKKLAGRTTFHEIFLLG